MKTRDTLEPLFILHRRPYRNTSLIVECFSRNHGRIALVARSARGLKSRYKNILQPFSLLLASWVGRGELKTLGTVEPSEMPYILDGEVLSSAFYLNELLMHLLHRDDPHPHLFDCYQDTLAKLSSLKGNLTLETTLRFFEKHLLQEIGYALPLVYEAHSHQLIHADFVYQYFPDKGFVRWENSLPQSSFLITGQSLIALNNEKIENEQTLKEIKYLMRAALAHHLNGRSIKSRELIV